jgi:hypothetical protein
MEIGAVFILVVVLALFAVAGVVLAGVLMRLRARKLHPKEDKIAGGQDDQPRRRPEHVRAETEQRTRFVGQR